MRGLLCPPMLGAEPVALQGSPQMPPAQDGCPPEQRSQDRLGHLVPGLGVATGEQQRGPVYGPGLAEHPAALGIPPPGAVQVLRLRLYRVRGPVFGDPCPGDALRAPLLHLQAGRGAHARVRLGQRERRQLACLLSAQLLEPGADLSPDLGPACRAEDGAMARREARHVLARGFGPGRVCALLSASHTVSPASMARPARTSTDSGASGWPTPARAASASSGGIRNAVLGVFAITRLLSGRSVPYSLARGTDIRAMDTPAHYSRCPMRVPNGPGSETHGPRALDQYRLTPRRPCARPMIRAVMSCLLSVPGLSARGPAGPFP
jgi:hypothetical protein